MAVVLILEPIFEADFHDCSHGFRPGRKAHDALDAIRQNLKAGRTEVYDAGLKGYFNTIPHDKLMACVRMRDGAKRRWTANGSPEGVSAANQIRTSGSTRGSGRKALLRKCRLSLSTLPVPTTLLRLKSEEGSPGCAARLNSPKSGPTTPTVRRSRTVLRQSSGSIRMRPPGARRTCTGSICRRASKNAAIRPVSKTPLIGRSRRTGVAT